MTKPMRRASVVSCWIALLPVMIACQPSDTVDREASERDAITTLRQGFLAAVEAGDAETVSLLFTEDATLLLPGERPVQGRPAIRQWWEKASREGRVSSLEAESFEVVIAGDWAFDRGAYAATRARPSHEDGSPEDAPPPRETPSTQEDPPRRGAPSPENASSREAPSSQEKAPVREHGNYLHVLRRQEDGAWKIARAIWNRLPPLVLEDVPRVPRIP